MHEMRSGATAREWQQLHLLGDAPIQGRTEGVRGRPRTDPVRTGGGGYQDERIASGFEYRPPKNFANLAHLSDRDQLLIGELYAMGLSRALLRVAEAIGFDAFMQVWSVLDGSPEAQHDASAGLRVQLPRLAAYRRYQRNRFVETLAVAGLSEPEIRATVKSELGESISDRHTRRLMQSGRVKT